MELTDAVERTESLVELIAKEAVHGEANRRVSQNVVDGIFDADLFRIVVPTSLGGHGLGLVELSEVTRVMAHGCPATAWTMSFLMLHAWMLSKLPEQGRSEVFAETVTPFAPAALAPTGTAVASGEGFVVNGRWDWGTGLAHASWVMVHAIEEGTGFASRFFVIPVEEVLVDDVWFTSGMRATSSNSIIVNNVFVPEYRSIVALSLLDSTVSVAGDGLAGLPVMSALALMAAAPAIGAGERAARLFQERLSNRVLAYTLGNKAIDQPASQIRLATVNDLVKTALERWRNAMDTIVNAETASPALRVDARLAAASVVKTVRQAVNIACEGSGASVYFESHPLQRIQRDLETMKGHVIFDWDRTAEMAGRYTLSNEIRPGDMV